MSYCITASGGRPGNNIYMARWPSSCQTWKFDKQKRIISTTYRGFCVDRATNNNNLQLNRCHNGRNQKWYFKDRAQLKTYDSGSCLNWHTGNNNLFMHKCHTGLNQNFWWNTGLPINVMGGVSGNRKWLSTTSDGGKVDLWLAAGSRQKWNLVKAGKGYYHIMLSFGVEGRGLRFDNAYLSVTSNGEKVDVYDKDDASGRQRWKIIKRGRGRGRYFNIMIAGGVSGNRKYLSTTSNGNKVDLWIKDDRSGRQRWVIPHALISTPKPTPRPTPRPTPVPRRNLVSGGGWKIIKGVKKCTISIENGAKYPCAVSPNYPKPYPREVSCEIKMKKTKYVSLHGSSEKYFDYLTLSGREYSGKFKGKKVAVKGNAKWTADFYLGTTGWKLCKSRPPKLKILPPKKKKRKWLPGDGRSNGGEKKIAGKYKNREACFQAVLRLAGQRQGRRYPINGATFGSGSCYVEYGWFGVSRSSAWVTMRLPNA